MSKKVKDNKIDLPTIPDKYHNANKLEEVENRLYEEKIYIENLKKESYTLSHEMKQKEIEFV